MMAPSKFLALATIVLAGLLTSQRASAACYRGDTPWPCFNPGLYTCNHDAVCNGNETSANCPSDCPCAHDTCATGAALNAACQDKVYLVWAVCYYDSYCCTTAWDQSCVNEANTWGTDWAQRYGAQTDGCRGNRSPGSN